MKLSKSIITIFKKEFITNEISSLVVEKKFMTKALKSLNDLKKIDIKRKVIIIEITVNEEIKELEKIIKGYATEVILILSKKEIDMKFSNSFRVITIPFRVENLFVLINNAFKSLERLRRNKKIGDLSFDPNESLLVDSNKKEKKLTELECRFLEYLYDRSEGSTKNDLLSNVWGYNLKMETHTIESLVYRLRKKIEKDPNNPKVITQVGKKYFLNQD